MSSSACRRCAQPLLVESDSGLCPVCLAIRDVADIPTLPELPFEAHPDFPPDARLTSAESHVVGKDAEPISDLPTSGQKLDGATFNDLAAPTPVEALQRHPSSPPGYELIHRLGGGGMGEVYLARELLAERLVAMKFLRRPGDQSAFDRFLIEFRALAGVDHPGVVRVFVADVLRCDPYFTMEYVRGESLGARLVRSGPFPPTEAATLISATARAVQVAHDAGVVHRDLKPSNILIGENGKPKVSDFGLAKRLNHDDGLTTTSGPVGTPAYMAPEQTSRHFGEAGPRADVYGLGATLYHLLTGIPPFSGSAADAVTRVLMTVPERPRAIRPEIPSALEGIVLKCLEKLPERRYPTAGELADDLERFLHGEKPKAPESTWARRMWHSSKPRLVPTLCAAAILLVVFALGASITSREEPAPKADLVEEARKELADDRPVILIGATGQPKYTRWLLGTSTLGASPHGDESCHYIALGYSLLELFPAPGIKKDRIELELRHLQSPITDPKSAVDDAYVGVYFGYSALSLPDSSIVHDMIAVDFCDGDVFAALNGIPPREKRVKLDRIIFQQMANNQPGTGMVRMEQLTFTPHLRRPGPWRSIRIDCAPDRLTAYWRDDSGSWITLADLGLKDFRDRRGGLRSAQKYRYPSGLGETVADWTPDAPLGIVAHSASLSVRNVCLTPLP